MFNSQISTKHETIIKFIKCNHSNYNTNILKESRTEDTQRKFENGALCSSGWSLCEIIVVRNSQCK